MIVYDSTRRPISLGQELYRGGEGIIYPLQGQPHLVAKLYMPAAPKGYDDKLAWMKANPPADPSRTPGHSSIAWPINLLYSASGAFAGYTMPHIKKAVPLLAVFNPRSRARTLPDFDTRYLHRTARNLASAIVALHGRGYVVGDINESNILITPAALVTMIDTDSFQAQEHAPARIITYPCPVGKPEYTPPELQGKVFRGLLRQPEHDYFGLGVLIFQLLMEGSHPFRAQWLGSGDPPSVEERIAKGWFPYVKLPGRNVAPPPNAPALENLHPGLATLVQRCFVDGHYNPRLRPSPDEWEQALAQAEQGLVKCANGHYFSNHLRVCPRCGASAPPGARTSQRGHTSQSERPPGGQWPSSPEPTPAYASAPAPAQTTASQGLKPAERMQAVWQAMQGRTAPALRVRDRIKQSPLPLWASWVMVTIVAWLTGFAARQVVGALANEALGNLAAGAVFGVMQWLVLRRHMVEAGWWLPVTAASFTAGLSLDAALGQTTMWPVTCTLTGFAQAAVWWRWVRQPIWWAFAAMAGWLVGIEVASLLGNEVPSVAGNLLAGLVNGAITGAMLVWLLQRQSRPAAGWVRRMTWRAVLVGITLGMLFVNSVSIGLRPCGWLDMALGLSRCVSVVDQQSPSVGLVFSADSALLAAQSPDYIASVWRASDGKLLHELVSGSVVSDSTASANMVAGTAPIFSANGSTLLALAGNTVLEWRLTDGELEGVHKLIAPRPALGEYITGARFSPGGSVVAVSACAQAGPPGLCTSAEIRLWRTTDGEYIGALKGFTNTVRSMAFSLDGTLLASGSCGEYDEVEQSHQCKQGQIRVWRLRDTRLLYEFGAHDNWVSSLAFSGDGRQVASGSSDNTVYVWRLDGELLHTLQHDSPVTQIAYTADGNIVIAASDSLAAWRVAEDTPVSVDRLPGAVISLAISPDGGLLAAGTTGNKLIFWKLH
jgi:hypothetical protein